MTKPIIPRLEPMADESFLGFLARAAAMNEISSVRHMLNSLGLPKNGFEAILSEARANVDIPEVLQVSRAWWQQATATPKTGSRSKNILFHNDRAPKELLFHNRLLPLHYVVRSGRRYAPGALRISAHNRYHWDIFGISFDFDTFELLNDTCHLCKRPLRLLGTVPLHLCNSCHADLTEAEPNFIRPADREAATFVADLFSDDELRRQRLIMRLHPKFRHLNPGVIYQLVLAFGQVAQTSVDMRKRGLAYPKELLEGARIIAEYPHRLLEILNRTSDLVVPNFYGRMCEKVARSATSGVSQAVEIVFRNLREDARPGLEVWWMEGENLMGVKRAAAELGIPVSTARKLVDQQVLKGTPVSTGARKHDAIHREDVLALGRQLSDKIAFGNITGRYGLPRTAIEQLVDAHLIRQHPLPLMSEVYTGAHAKRSEIEVLFRDLLQAVAVRPDPDAALIPLAAGFALYGPHPRPWAGLLMAALEGLLPGRLFRQSDKPNFALNTLLIDEVLFDSIWNDSVPWDIPAEPDRNVCTGVEVEERLSIFPRDMADLLFIRRLTRLPDAPFVGRDQVLNLARNFISSTEIAARLKIRPSAVKGLVTSGRIPPRNGPMWRRRDMTNFLPVPAIKQLPMEVEADHAADGAPDERFQTIITKELIKSHLAGRALSTDIAASRRRHSRHSS